MTQQGMEKKVTDLRRRSDQNRHDIDELYTLTTRTNDNITHLRTHVDNQFSTLRTDMNALSTEVSTLRTDVNGLSTEVSTLRTDVDNRFSTLRTDVNALSTEVSTLRTDVNGLSGEVSTLRTDMNGLSERNEVRFASVERLLGEVVELLREGKRGA